MLLIIGLLLVFVFGFLLSVILVEKMHAIERLGMAFLLGFGVFTLLMFCYSTLGVKITLQSTFIALGSGIAIEVFFFRLFKRKISLNFAGLRQAFVKMSRLEKILTLLILGLCAGSLVISMYFPVYIWDALALYDFRAKVIAEQGFYIQIAKNFFWFDGYPLFTSLSHTLVYLFGGKNPQFLYSFMYISFIAVFYSSLRKFTDRKNGLIGSLLLATTPVFFDHSTFAYTNLPYSLFLSMGTIYLYNWLVKEKKLGYLILSAILTGLSTWTRSTEPFWMINIVFLIGLIIYNYKKYLFPLVLYTASFLVIREPWNFVNYYMLTADGTEKAPLIVSEVNTYTAAIFGIRVDMARIYEVALFIYKNVIVSWYPLLFLFTFCVAINVRRIFKKQSSILLLLIFMYFGFLVYSTYVYSFGVPYWKEIPDSARRMVMFFMPMMIYYIGLTFGQIQRNTDGKR